MVHFVGAGTGATDLITVRGQRLIENADVIIYAGSLINKDLLRAAKTGCEMHDSAAMTLSEIIDVIKAAAAKNKDIVRLHTGEPSIYGAVREQMDELDKAGIEYDSCPGVSAAFGAASSLNIEYTLPGITQTLIITRMEGRTEVPELEKIEALAAHHTSMAIYLSSGMMERVQEALIKGGLSPDTPAAIVYKATWDDEKILRCHVRELTLTGMEAGIDRLAVILVGEAIEHTSYDRSRLYSEDFSTGYRDSKKKAAGSRGSRKRAAAIWNSGIRSGKLR